MFTILGGDGKEYGPATLAQIRAWVASGRANLDTQAKLAGDTEWRRLGEIPEFNGTADANTPPPLDGAAPVELVPADRGRRLLAMIIDRLLEGLAALPGLLLLGPVFFRAVVDSAQGHTPDFNGIEAGGMLLGVALLGIGGLALTITQVVMISTRGQSLGKRFLGLRIVRFGTGAPAGFAHGWLLRSVVPGVISFIPWIGFVFVIVNYSFIFREDRRCLHDLIADTRVVKA
ncbi:MAG: RDD family protein [Undibacterium sp.]|nr:RDD family protein [Opitutaceae bacterium]